jgi:hypothetical protein
LREKPADAGGNVEHPRRTDWSRRGLRGRPDLAGRCREDGSGQIHVTIRATLNGIPNYANYFTSKDMCDDFVKNEQITPQSAPSGDIN